MYDEDATPIKNLPSLNHLTFKERGWRLNVWLHKVDKRNASLQVDYLTDVVCELIIRTYLSNLK